MDSVPPLRRHDVHVWRGSLDVPDEMLPHLICLLSDDELDRADRFHRLLDRNRYIVGRGRLRVILGRYVDRDPAGLRFVYNTYRKPSLEASGNHQERMVQFNLSHSDGLALYAFTIGRQVGIDLERVRALEDAACIARRFFSDRESAALDELPAWDWIDGFFRCWTRKEAYIKASGKGLSLPLDSFDVTVNGPADLLRTADDDAGKWSLVNLRPGLGFAGALAVEGRGVRLSGYHYSDRNEVDLHRSMPICDMLSACSS